MKNYKGFTLAVQLIINVRITSVSIMTSLWIIAILDGISRRRSSLKYMS